MRLVLISTTLTIAMLASTAFADVPPRSVAEQVAECWNQGVLSTEASKVTITVMFNLRADGIIESDTITLIEHDAPNQQSRDQAYNAARRAIIRCTEDGYASAGLHILEFGQGGVNPPQQTTPLIEV